MLTPLIPADVAILDRNGAAHGQDTGRYTERTRRPSDILLTEDEAWPDEGASILVRTPTPIADRPWSELGGEERFVATGGFVSGLTGEIGTDGADRVLRAVAAGNSTGSASSKVMAVVRREVALSRLAEHHGADAARGIRFELDALGLSAGESASLADAAVETGILRPPVHAGAADDPFACF